MSASTHRANIAGYSTLGAFVVAIIFGLNATHGSPVKERATVTADFDDIGGLYVGDDVRIASVRVGFVKELRLKDGHAFAVMKIDDPETKVYADARAGVIDRSGLGQKFVNLDPGSPSAGPLTRTIGMDHTVRAQDINGLFNTFDDKTRAAAGSTLREFGGGMDGHAQDLNDLLHSAPGILSNSGTISDTLAANNGSSLVGMMQSADTISARFRGRQQHVANVLDQLGTTLDAIAVDDGQPLEQTIAKGPETLKETRAALDDLRKPLKHTASAMKDLRPGAKALGDAMPNLRGFMKDAVDPLEKVPAVSKQAVPALESLTDLTDENLRPLSRQFITTGGSGAPPVTVIRQYIPEIVRYFTDGASTFGNKTQGGQFARILAITSDESVGGKPAVVKINRNPYVKPGETDDQGAN
jgi:phospholipid/cholesterol/gamma-HCH transport system substrate-binding protein